MTPEVANFLREFGLPIFMLVTLSYAGAKGIWVWGRELKAAYELVAYERAEKVLAREDADEWKDIALKALTVGEKVVEAVGPDG